MSLSAESKKIIDRWVAKYPRGKQQSAVIEALKLAQADNGGFLDSAAIEAVAQYLKMPKITVLEVATFYENYAQAAGAKHTIRMCHNISCMLNGADELIDYLNHKIQQDGLEALVAVKKVECLGACIDAPMCQIGDAYHQNLTVEKLDKMLEKLK